ncbi:Hsp20/alpha crystallin family protein [Halochromatium roseum]|uniref:Hsp20/alpha crystallin family protein n=1 Tax=Halochromatium roseum TaxID=391920 RepID=UPI00191388ED|nr:Hsp20/alpha crystallin family protein [Halochromatium roseum]MBK5941374.1 hypothetical protein [Halochromatium roseum]
MARLTAAALGISLLVALTSSFAAPPQGPVGAQPMPAPAMPYRAPLPDSGAGHRWSTGQVRMTQERTEEAYILIIDLNGLAPDNVQVRPFGQNVLVRTRRDAHTRRSETFDDGRGYRESYRVSTGSSTRRLPVPPDGDVLGLTREDGAEQVRVLIPRRQMPGWR